MLFIVGKELFIHFQIFLVHWLLAIIIILLILAHVRIVHVILRLSLLLQYLRLVLELLHQLLLQLLIVFVVEVKLRVMLVMMHLPVVGHLELLSQFLLIKLFLVFDLRGHSFLFHLKLLVVGCTVIGIRSASSHLLAT